jgi:hypothetical protein
MRCLECQNISDISAKVVTNSGDSITLPPKTKIENVDIDLMRSDKSKLSFVQNLTEVNENSSQKLLFD